MRLGAQGKAEQRLGGSERRLGRAGEAAELCGAAELLGAQGKAEQRLGGAEWLGRAERRLGGAGEAAELCGAAEILGVPLTACRYSVLLVAVCRCWHILLIVGSHSGPATGPYSFSLGLVVIGSYWCRWVSFSLGLIVVGLPYSLSLGPAGGHHFRWVLLLPGYVLFDTLEWVRGASSSCCMWFSSGRRFVLVAGSERQ